MWTMWSISYSMLVRLTTNISCFFSVSSWSTLVGHKIFIFWRFSVVVFSLWFCLRIFLLDDTDTDVLAEEPFI